MALIKLQKYIPSPYGDDYRDEDEKWGSILIHHELIHWARPDRDGDTLLNLTEEFDGKCQIYVKESLDEILALIKEVQS